MNTMYFLPRSVPELTRLLDAKRELLISAQLGCWTLATWYATPKAGRRCTPQTYGQPGLRLLESENKAAREAARPALEQDAYVLRDALLEIATWHTFSPIEAKAFQNPPEEDAPEPINIGDIHGPTIPAPRRRVVAFAKGPRPTFSFTSQAHVCHGLLANGARAQIRELGQSRTANPMAMDRARQQGLRTFRRHLRTSRASRPHGLPCLWRTYEWRKPEEPVYEPGFAFRTSRHPIFLSAGIPWRGDQARESINAEHLFPRGWDDPTRTTFDDAQLPLYPLGPGVGRGPLTPAEREDLRNFLGGD